MQSNILAAKFAVTQSTEMPYELKVKSDNQRVPLEFFIEALNGSFEFLRDTDSDTERGAWELTFFKDSDFETTYAVSFECASTSKPLERSDVSVFVPAPEGMDQAIETFKNVVQAKASVNLETDCTELSDNTVLVGVRNSLGVLGKEYQFERYVVLHALGLAYQEVLQAFLNRCRNAVEQGRNDTLLKIQEEATLFMTCHLYRQPVRTDRAVLRQAWQHIRKSLALADLTRECEEQFDRVGQLCAARDKRERIRVMDEAQERRDRVEENQKLFKRLSIVFGVVFTLGNTPSDLVSNANDWLDLATGIFSQMAGSEPVSGVGSIVEQFLQ